MNTIIALALMATTAISSASCSEILKSMGNEIIPKCDSITFEVSNRLGECGIWKDKLDQKPFENSGISPRNDSYTHYATKLRDFNGVLCSATDVFILDQASEIAIGYFVNRKGGFMSFTMFLYDDRYDLLDVWALDTESDPGWKTFKVPLELHNLTSGYLELMTHSSGQVDFGIDFIDVDNLDAPECRDEPEPPTEPPTEEPLEECEYFTFENDINNHFRSCDSVADEFVPMRFNDSHILPRNERFSHFLTNGRDALHCARTQLFAMDEYSHFEVGYYNDLRGSGAVSFTISVYRESGSVFRRWPINTSTSHTIWRTFVAPLGFAQSTKAFIQLTVMAGTVADFGMDYLFLFNTESENPICLPRA